MQARNVNFRTRRTEFLLTTISERECPIFGFEPSGDVDVYFESFVPSMRDYRDLIADLEKGPFHADPIDAKPGAGRVVCWFAEAKDMLFRVINRDAATIVLHREGRSVERYLNRSIELFGLCSDKKVLAYIE